MNNLVSIITPSYNSSKYISQTIDSVLNQTYKNWEMIIVDDCSLDKSNDIIKDYMKKDNRIKLIELEKNHGVSFARNKSIEEAAGRYIVFLDSDDVWMPNKLEKQINFMHKYKLSVTYSAYETMDENGKYINTRTVKKTITYNDMLKSNHIGNLTGIYDSKELGKYFMKDMGHEDYILWLEIMKKVQITKGISEPLARYRILTNSISANKWKVLKWQWSIYRNISNLNLFESSYNFLWYIYYALKKRY